MNIKIPNNEDSVTLDIERGRQELSLEALLPYVHCPVMLRVQKDMDPEKDPELEICGSNGGDLLCRLRESCMVDGAWLLGRRASITIWSANPVLCQGSFGFVQETPRLLLWVAPKQGEEQK